MSHKSTWIIEDNGERLDLVLLDLIDREISRSALQQLIKNGHVLVNEQVVKANYRVSLGEKVTVIWPNIPEERLLPEPMDLHILFEDDHIIVVNKQRGLVVHPAPGHDSGTLVNGLLAHTKHLSTLNDPHRPGIVHRIDKDTSGLLVIAKTNAAHESLAEQLRARTVLRKYFALVHGKLAHDEGTIDAPIGRNPKQRQMFTVTNHNSKQAITHFVTLERFNDYSWLALKLETGRTHQIRVHLKFIDHPIVGDPVYGKSKSKEMDGQVLHAGELGFNHPITGEYMEFTAPLPEEFTELLQRLRTE